MEAALLIGMEGFRPSRSYTGGSSGRCSNQSRESGKEEEMDRASLHIAEQHPSAGDHRRRLRASDAQGMRERAGAREV
jgi:hypothetical protein